MKSQNPIVRLNIKWFLTILLLVLAAISPNLFVAAQSGLAPFSTLVLLILFPSVLSILLVLILLKLLNYDDVLQLALNGLWAGIVATFALELFRESGFRLGMMPGELPRLMGVLILNQFASGPDLWSDLSGWTYHFWNGGSFGLIFSLLFGQSKIWQGLLFGLLIGAGFMISPVVKSLGIGIFGIEYKNGYEFSLIVTLAHLAYGLSLSLILIKWNKGFSDLFNRWIKSEPTII